MGPVAFSGLRVSSQQCWDEAEVSWWSLGHQDVLIRELAGAELGWGEDATPSEGLGDPSQKREPQLWSTGVVCSQGRSVYQQTLIHPACGDSPCICSGHAGQGKGVRLPFLGEGDGNPPQCSCLENPRDGGAWWAAVYGVAQSRTRLKWFSMHACIGEGNGNPLQYSCLENLVDRGAWWAAVYRIAPSRTRLKRLGSSSSLSSCSEVLAGAERSWATVGSGLDGVEPEPSSLTPQTRFSI